MHTIYVGAVISPRTLTEYTRMPSAVVCVSKETGLIEWIEQLHHQPKTFLQDVLEKHGIVDVKGIDVIELKRGEFLMPGFIDTHTVRTFSLAYIPRGIDECNCA